jgi:hypothetical protein
MVCLYSEPPEKVRMWTVGPPKMAAAMPGVPAGYALDVSV